MPFHYENIKTTVCTKLFFYNSVAMQKSMNCLRHAMVMQRKGINIFITEINKGISFLPEF